MTDTTSIQGGLATLGASGWQVNPAAQSANAPQSLGPQTVMTPGDLPFTAAVNIARDASTTRQAFKFPTGAKSLAISYRLLPGATAVTNQFMRYVLNAYSDADAVGKLATDGAFIPIMQGDDHLVTAPFSDPILRIDFLTEQAVGVEKTVFQVVAGV